MSGGKIVVPGEQLFKLHADIVQTQASKLNERSAAAMRFLIFRCFLLFDLLKVDFFLLHV